MFDFNTNEGYFLHLLKCGLKSEKPEEPPVGIDFEAIFELAKKQDVENIVFLSIDQLENNIDSNLYSIWQEAYYKRMKYSAFQDMALEELIEVFTKAGIDCMPLKGSVIKNYYPSPDLRCMGDIDFLVREQNRQVVRDIMHSLGYIDDILDDGQVDGFKREKLVYVEIHYDFSDVNHAYHNLFTIDWDKLVSTDIEHLYKMTIEDLYYFNVGHYAKNMHNRGMGIRAAIDCYVLWNEMNDEQQQNVLRMFLTTELKKFNDSLLKIAEIWFDGIMDHSLDTVQQYLLNTKTYSSKKDEITMYAVKDNLDDSNVKYVMRKIFPYPNELYKRFNIKHKCFVLLPFLWFYRICLQIFGNEKKWDKAKEQLDNFKLVSNDDIEYQIQIRREFGLMEQR